MASLQPVDEAVFLTDVFLCTDATPEGIAHYTLWSKRDLSHHEVCGRLCVPSCPAPKSSHLRVCSVDRPLRGWLVVQTPPSSSTLAIRRQFRRAVHPVVPRPRVRQNGAVLLSSSTGHGVHISRRTSRSQVSPPHFTHTSPPALLGRLFSTFVSIHTRGSARLAVAVANGYVNNSNGYMSSS